MRQAQPQNVLVLKSLLMLGSRQAGMEGASAAADNHTPDMTVVLNGGRAMSTHERVGLQAMGFDVGSSNPRLEDEDLR